MFEIREGFQVKHPSKLTSWPDKLNGKLRRFFENQSYWHLKILHLHTEFESNLEHWIAQCIFPVFLQKLLSIVCPHGPPAVWSAILSLTGEGRGNLGRCGTFDFSLHFHPGAFDSWIHDLVEQEYTFLPCLEEK